MPKYECCFCGNTNTKIESVYESSGFLGLSQNKIGEKEIIDERISFYRCVDCGRFYCEQHYQLLCNKVKKEKGLFTNKTIRYDECPKCNSDKVKKVS